MVSTSRLRLGLAATLVGTFACAGDDEEEPDFGRNEMQAAIEGTWTGTLDADDGTSTSLEVSLTYRAPEKTPACSSRELHHPLCDTQTWINLGAFVGATVSGMFSVSGSRIGDAGYVQVTIRALEESLPGVGPEVLTLEGERNGDRLEGRSSDDRRSFTLTRQ